MERITGRRRLDGRVLFPLLLLLALLWATKARAHVASATSGERTTAVAGEPATTPVLLDILARQPLGGLCGDGLPDAGETCDDGNTLGGDGCSATCHVEDGWSCTAAMAPVPAANVVADGSFEDGTPNPHWAEFSTNFDTPICSVPTCSAGPGTGPDTGLWWAWFGGLEAVEVGSLEQSVTIPVDATDLTFRLEMSRCDTPADFLEVQVDGDIIFRVDGGDPACDAIGYNSQNVDISTFADGASHQLRFYSEVNGVSGVSNFYVDTVEILGGALPGMPSQCTPTPTTVGCNLPAVGFEAGIPLPNGWLTATTGPVVWSSTDDAVRCDTGRGNQTPGSGLAACADADYTNNGGAPYVAELWTNPFDLTLPLTATLNFAAAYNDNPDTPLDNFHVDIWDGATWTSLLTWAEDHHNPGELVALDLAPYLGTADARLRFVYEGPGWDWYAQVDDVALNCVLPPMPAVSLAKTVSATGGCGANDDIVVPWNADVTYCYTAENTGNVILSTHTLTDTVLGPLLSDEPIELAPGESFAFLETVTIVPPPDPTNNVITNCALWTATSADEMIAVSNESCATVSVVAPTDVSLTGFGGQANGRAWGGLAGLVGLALVAGAGFWLARRMTPSD